MAINPIPISGRNQKIGPITAGGGYTLPQNVFLPHPATQAFGFGNQVQGPRTGAPAIFAGGAVRTSTTQPPRAFASVYGVVGFPR